MVSECPFCKNPVKESHNFCRRCGARIVHETQKKEEIIDEKVVEDSSSPTGVSYIHDAPLEEEKTVVEDEEKEKPLTDDQLVERISNIIIQREEYATLLKQKQEVENEINKLLDRVQNKLIPRDEAIPKIRTLKAEVEEIKNKESQFEDLEGGILPIEEIIEDRNNEREKLRKLEAIKGDKSISRSSYEEVEAKYKKNIENLTLKLNIELAKMRKTFDALDKKIKSIQKESELLYIKYQTGEKSEKVYEEEKQKLSKQIQGLKKVSNVVANILAEAR